jgi:O-antigen/teichoic acid export membrane protein
MAHTGEHASDSLLHGLAWTASGKAAGALLHIAVVAVLARLLAPADFGLIAAALIVISFFSLLARLGLGQALVQRPEIDDVHISTTYVTSLVLGLLLAGIVWLGAPVFAAFLRMQDADRVLRALAWLFPLTALSTVGEALLQRQARFGLLAKLEVASYAVGFGVFGILAALAGLGVWALVLAHYAHAVLTLALVMLYSPPLRITMPDIASLRSLLGYGGGVTLGRFFNHVALQIDNLIVGRWLGAAALGMYGRAYQLMSMPATVVGQALDRVLFPAMSRLQIDTHRLSHLFLRGVAAIALLTLPGSALAIVLAPELIAILLGPQWDAAIAPFQVLALGLFFRTSYRVSDSLAYATGAVYRRAWRQALYALCVCAGALTGQRFGLTGVATGVLAALAVNYALMAQLSLSQLGIGWGRFAAAQLTAVRLGIITAAAAWTSATLLRIAGLPAVLLVCAVTAIVTTALVLLVRLRPRLIGSDAQWLATLIASRASRYPARRARRRPQDHPPGRGPVILEFVGLPGAGKTVLSTMLIRELTMRGHRCSGRIGIGGDSRFARAAAAARILAVNLPLLARVVRFAASLKPRYRGRLQLALKTAAWPRRRDMARARALDVMVLDEGVVQNVWGIGLGASADRRPKADSMLRALLADRKAVFAFVLVDTDVDTALARIRRRRDPDARVDRAPPREQERLLAVHGAQLRQLLSVAIRLTGAPVLRIDAAGPPGAPLPALVTFVEGLLGDESRPVPPPASALEVSCLPNMSAIDRVARHPPPAWQK